MAVRVRLTRVGGRKNAIWRVVVADGRSPRDGRFIEMIGHYNPQTQPSEIVIDRQRLQHWLDRGAEPTNTVKKLMRAENSRAGAATAVAGEPSGEGVDGGAADRGADVAADASDVPAAEAETEADAPAAEADAPAAEAEEPAEEPDGATGDEPASEGEAESG